MSTIAHIEVNVAGACDIWAEAQPRGDVSLTLSASTLRSGTRESLSGDVKGLGAEVAHLGAAAL